MRKLRVAALWVILTTAVASAASAAGSQDTASRSSVCRITGMVVDGQTQAGVTGAAVTLRGPARATALAASAAEPAPGPCASGCVTTAGADGRFAFTGLAPGAYALSASVAGFSESQPLPLALGGASCGAIVDIVYRLNMRAESKAEIPRSPDATAISNPIAPALTGDAVALTPGALDDVFRAFQAQPGAAASQDNRNDLLVRGGGALENQTRIDGFDVPNPTHFGAQGGTGGALSILPPWLIDRGTLEMSGFSVAYGDRMSSVAEISLRPGRTDRVHAMIGAGVGGAMGVAEGSLGDRGAWIVSARRSLLDAVFHEQDGEAVPNYADALFKVTRSLGDRHTVTVLGLGTKDSVVIRDSKTGNDEVSGDERIGLAGVRIGSTWSPRASSTVAASIGTSEVAATSVNGTVIDAIDRGRDVEFRFRADLRRTSTPLGDVLVGAAVKSYHYDYDLYVNDLWTPYEIKMRDLGARDRRSFTDTAGYAEVERTLHGRGRILVGLRLDHWSAAGVTAGSPRLKAEFLPARSVRVVGYWGTYRQGVPYIWMASAPANVTLPPIVSHQFGGGVDVEPRRWLRVGLEGFNKRYRNYPVDPAVPGRVLVSSSADFESPYVGPLVSGGRVRAAGLDASAQLMPATRFHVGMNYSHWRVSQLGLDGAWRPAEHEVRNQARVEVLFRPASQWSTGVRWRYVSGRPYTPYDVKSSLKIGRAVYDLTRINALDYPHYERLDARVDRTFAAGRTATMVYLELDNVFDRGNVLIYDWSRALKGPKPLYQWGRTVIAGVRVEF